MLTNSCSTLTHTHSHSSREYTEPEMFIPLQQSSSLLHVCVCVHECIDVLMILLHTSMKYANAYKWKKCVDVLSLFCWITPNRFIDDDLGFILANNETHAFPFGKSRFSAFKPVSFLLSDSSSHGPHTSSLFKCISSTEHLWERKSSCESKYRPNFNYTEFENRILITTDTLME